MNSKRAFYIMIGGVVFSAGLVIASVVLGDMLLHKQADKLVALKADADVIETQQTALVQAKKDLEKYADLGKTAAQIVPQDKDQARAVREIISIADGSGIRIASITFPSSNLGQKSAAAAATDTSGAATPAPNPLTQAKPVKGIEGLSQLDISIASDSNHPTSYSRLVSFLAKLEQNRRTSQVSQISIQPDSQNRTNLNFTLTVTVYIKP